MRHHGDDEKTCAFVTAFAISISHTMLTEWLGMHELSSVKILNNKTRFSFLLCTLRQAVQNSTQNGLQRAEFKLGVVDFEIGCSFCAEGSEMFCNEFRHLEGDDSEVDASSLPPGTRITH